MFLNFSLQFIYFNNIDKFQDEDVEIQRQNLSHRSVWFAIPSTVNCPLQVVPGGFGGRVTVACLMLHRQNLSPKGSCFA